MYINRLVVKKKVFKVFFIYKNKYYVMTYDTCYDCNDYENIIKLYNF